MVTDDLDLFRLVDNVRYLTKGSTMDNQIRDRILATLDAYDAIINCDINMAYDLVRDLTIIRALIKKDSEDLDRKFTIFEKKLRKIADTILPKDEDEAEMLTIKQPVVTSIFQDNDVRIIDIVSRKSALNKMEDAKELVSIIKEVLKLSESPTLPMVLKCDLQSRMNDLLNLIKVDGGLGLKLRRDVIDAKNALKKGQDGEPELENKLRILKLKLQKCNEELHRKEEEIMKLLKQLDEPTKKALDICEETTSGTRQKRRAQPLGMAFDWVTKGITNNNIPYNSIGQVPLAQSGPLLLEMPAVHGFVLVPLDHTMCPGSAMPGSYGPATQPGFFPLQMKLSSLVPQVVKKKEEDIEIGYCQRPSVSVTQTTYTDTVGVESLFKETMEKALDEDWKEDQIV